VRQPCTSGATGLGHVDVQTGPRPRQRSARAESRGARSGHGLDAAVDHSLVAGEAGKSPPLVHSPLVAQGVGHVWEVVAMAMEFIAAMLEKERNDPTPSPSAATRPSLILPFGVSGVFLRDGPGVGGEACRPAPNSGAAAAAVTAPPEKTVDGKKPDGCSLCSNS